MSQISQSAPDRLTEAQVQAYMADPGSLTNEQFAALEREILAANKPDPATLDSGALADSLFQMAMYWHRTARGRGHNQHFERCCDPLCCYHRAVLGIVGYGHGYEYDAGALGLAPSLP